MNSAGLLLAVFLLAVALRISAFGQAPGDLDLTFSGDGKLTDGIWARDDGAHGIVIQPDGKIVALGTSAYGMRANAFALTRYNADGSLDVGFGTGGKVITRIGAIANAHSVAIQTDGKIVAAGISFATSIIDNPHFALARYNLDGSLDTSFDGDGKVVTAIGLEDDAYSVAIQTDGRIVVSGSAYNGSDSDFAVVRYNADGSLDTSFGGDGTLTTAIGPDYDTARCITLQPDGRIVAAGYSYVSLSHSNFALTRYNSDGSLDTSFDGDGIAITPIGTSDDRLYSVAIQPDGKLVAAGSTRLGTNGGVFALARYNTDGSLDASFGGNGIATTPIGSGSVANSVAIQPDGKIVAAGSSGDNSSHYHFALARYNTRGSLDTSFDDDGKVITAVGLSYDTANAIAIQPDGRIVAAGFSLSATDYEFYYSDFALTRYNIDGSLDTTFDGDGKAVTAVGGYFQIGAFSGVTIQPDGKIIAVGSSDRAFAVARYNPDGSPDTTFGGGTGKVRSTAGSNATSVAVQPDGKIVVGGGCFECGNDFVVTRYNPDGSPDNSFNGVPSNKFGPAYWVHVLSDGKIIALAGSYFATNFSQIVRLNSNGSLDTTFGGGDGIADVPIGTIAGAIQTDGKIVVAGYRFNGSNLDFAAARCNPDGSLDTSFDGDGYVITTIGTSNNWANSVAVQSDGKIVAAGRSANGSNLDFTIVRYNSNGSLDTGFDSDGIALTPISSGDDVASAVAVQNDGKLIAAGSSNGDFALARYNPNGSLDMTFGGGDGVVTVDFNAFSSDSANGMALDRQGRAVVVGASDGAFALARIILGSGAVPSTAPFDFDGDGRSDVSVFRPSDRVWYLDRSSQGFSATQFGIATDKIVPADYDGDGKTDIAIFRDGVWWRMNSRTLTVETVQFGQIGDIPVPADYTGDGQDELAVYRHGQWWTHDLSNGNSGLTNFGIASDKPVPADYDGDGKTDTAIYRDGAWWRINSSTSSVEVFQFGLALDRPVVGDYDGDSKADLAVYRDGTWYLQQSRDGFRAFGFGIASDIPAPADYDGDGKTDAAVYRNGTWYVRKSIGGVLIQQFGLANDKPLPAAYLPQSSDSPTFNASR